MVQLSATRCSCIAILWVSLVSFAAITLCVASQRYRLNPETFGYTLIFFRTLAITWWDALYVTMSAVGSSVKLLTPRSRVLVQKLTVTQLVKKFPAFYGTWRFITVFTGPYSEPDAYPTGAPNIPRSKSHTNFLLPMPFQRIRPFPRPCVTFRNKLLLLLWDVSSSPNPHAGGPPLVCCPRLLIRYIHSYSPYLQVVFSIRNTRTRHVVYFNGL
jgi:hypothetical protein